MSCTWLQVGPEPPELPWDGDEPDIPDITPPILDDDTLLIVAVILAAVIMSN